MGGEMKLSILGVLILASWACNVQSQHHVHGQGSVFIVQENELWQVQFLLPASDILGFEHSPENKHQQYLVDQFEKNRTDFNNLVQFDSTCVQRNDSQSALASTGQDESPTKQHHDLEFIYLLECEQAISEMTFPILQQYHNLKSLHVQWSTQLGQGSKLITASAPQLQWR